MEQIRLDIIPKGLMPVCHASQYDKGRVIRFNLMDGLQPYTLEGTETLEVDVRKTDMNIVTADVTNTSSTYVEIVTTEQMTACEGDNLGELKITKGDVVVASINFILRVEEDPLKDGIESETEIANLSHQISDLVSEQYDSENVIFDAEPTEDHGNGYTVTSEGIKAAIEAKPDNLSDLGDVNISSPTTNQALVWDEDAQEWTNGEVSTVGSIDDLDDVDTTGKADGDSLRYDNTNHKWVAKPTTIEMTQAEYNAIVDFTPYANTHIVITDAPNLNATASDIEYSSGVTVKQAIDSKANKSETLYQVGDTVSGIFYMSGFVGGNNIIYVMPQFKKALSDSINGLNITIQNDNKITIYRINGDILTTSATSTGVYGLANGFRININYPNNTFDNSLLGTPIYIACTLSIEFT